MLDNWKTSVGSVVGQGGRWNLHWLLSVYEFVPKAKQKMAFQREVRIRGTPNTATK